MSQQEILDTLASVFVDILPEVDKSAITREASMRDLGANSIDRADIITETMEKLGITVPMVNFGNAKNIGDVVDIMAREAKP
ncbi:acyl carrier protein [Streptomyces sp. 7-21]|jgi:polyketide biosynthesis acyl carrier protein|uniref:acyl carrier protein n=1 Tax=Streptomyces sp. 7-21 TaxID=2802283 RepID=UPI00191FB59C|nr:acyl carrier protein [Streptomyces sp. 7-21]MBL1065921.1 acyl carrier protein [Streptomyces sp. 7-21]